MAWIAPNAPAGVMVMVVPEGEPGAQRKRQKPDRCVPAASHTNAFSTSHSPPPPATLGADGVVELSWRICTSTIGTRPAVNAWSVVMTRSPEPSTVRLRPRYCGAATLRAIYAANAGTLVHQNFTSWMW